MKLSNVEFAKFLHSLADSIEQGDSFEGSLQYTCMEEHLAPREFEITGAVRTGNRNGQGGMSLLQHSQHNQTQQPEG